jgi:exoribonuclease R
VKTDLEFDRTMTARHGGTAEVNATNTDANLLAVRIEEAALTTTVATMTPSPVRAKYERKLRRLAERRSRLTDRLTDFDGVELTDNDFDLYLIDLSLTATVTYMGEVTAHKATLPN